MLRLADGPDPAYRPLETSRGRLGPVYRLQTDLVTRRLAVECKNRETIGSYLWTWLDGIGVRDKVPVLVVKRNRRRALVVIGLDDFCRLIGDGNAAARALGHPVDI